MTTPPRDQARVELLRADAAALDGALTDAVPYAYAARAAGLLFTAGACPLDEHGDVAHVGDVAGQAALVMRNLVAALAAAGCALSDVAKSTVYVASSERSDLVAAWDVVRAAMGAHDAPSTLLGVAVLGYPDQLVEVEAVAVLPPGRPAGA